ncbi:MAG: histidine phosphatase family protein [Acidimicrobiales bacterium]
MRHARPEHVEDADGPADPELTEVGHRQAKAVAEWLGSETLNALYTSPMRRARQTAAPLEALTGLTATVVPGVREYDAEASTYIPGEVMRSDKEAWRRFLANEMAADRSAFAAEVAESLQALIAAHRGDRIAVICHGGVINMWATELLGLEPQMFFNPDYTSINRFRAASSGERSIVSLNETGHLRGDPELLLG